jgi:hypothetical protein
MMMLTPAKQATNDYCFGAGFKRSVHGRFGRQSQPLQCKDLQSCVTELMMGDKGFWLGVLKTVQTLER